MKTCAKTIQRFIPFLLISLFVAGCRGQDIAPTATAPASPPPTPQPTHTATAAPSATPLDAPPYESTSDGRGLPLIVWEQTDETGSCRQARVGREWLEVGSCDEGDVAVYPLSADWQAELLQLSSDYTSFKTDTKNGSIELYAADGLTASPPEARLIAWWVARLVQETETGQTVDTTTPVLTWQRQQDEQCQQLHVTLTGTVAAFSCDNGAVVELMQARITAEKQGQLFNFYDRLGSVETDTFTFAGQGSAPLTAADEQAIERFAEGLFVPMSVSAIADEGVAIMPVAQAAYIRFASWSPNSRWFAYWDSTAEDIDRQANPIQEPLGTLTFINAETGEPCAMPLFDSDTQNQHMVWTADNRAVVSVAGKSWRGLPCQPDSFVADETAPPTATTDAALFANGRYRIQTDILDENANPIPVRTTLFDTANDQPLYTVEWQSQSYVDGCCSGEWVSPSQYLINGTMERPLLIDAELGVLDVALDIFKAQPLSSTPDGDMRLYHALALPAEARDQFHLFLTLRGDLGEDFPAIQLYHAERGLVESLPAGGNLWNLSDIEEWIPLYEEVGVDQLFPGRQRTDHYNLWARRLEDVDLEGIGGEWQLIAPAISRASWNDDQSEIAFTQNEKTVVWQTFPEGEALGRWHSDYYIWRNYFSANGRYLVTIGTVPGSLDHALLLHKRNPE